MRGLGEMAFLKQTLRNRPFETGLARPALRHRPCETVLQDGPCETETKTERSFGIPLDWESLR